MATKGEHEKPETVDDEHQPIVKKVRLDVDAKVAEDVKKVKIDENAAPQPEVGGHEGATVEKTSSPVNEAEDAKEKKEEENKETKLNTTGSAFGGFSAFSGKNAFAAFTTPANANGFGAKASAATDSGFGGFATKASSGFGDSTPSSSSSTDATNSSSGFASFQNTSPVTFASFAASQPTTDGFGAKASSSSATDFSDAEVAKKTEPVVPALTEAELANGEEGEQILVEKRTKLFKLVENDYAEVGIGPVRVLNSKEEKTDDDKSTARIVMRRESYPHGPGTKLLMNASLGSCLVCEKKTEKTMLLTVLEANEDPETKKTFIPVTYLMRFGSADDLDVVMAQIQAHMHSSTSAASSS